MGELLVIVSCLLVILMIRFSLKLARNCMTISGINELRCKQTGYGIGSAAEPKASDCSLSSSPQSGGESTPTRLNTPQFRLKWTTLLMLVRWLPPRLFKPLQVSLKTFQSGFLALLKTRNGIKQNMKQK